MTEVEDDLAEISASEDEDEGDVRKHAKLIDAISSLDGKKKSKLSERTVPVAQVSEFSFSSADKKKVALHELVGSLKENASHGELKKQLRSVQRRNKVVSVPLPNYQKQKLDRSLAYESTSKEVSKWQPVVEENRKAEQIIFPIQNSAITLQTTDKFVKRFKPRTPLEMEVAAALAGSSNVQTKDRELTVAEEKALKAMSLEEARERRAELMKYRALLSYKEAKARWQGKIKSKKYHRVLKKEKMKKEKRAIEEMQQNDPEGYAEKLHEADKQRIQERMSLKHRGGSKFAKKKMMYSKFDDQTRQQVQDMLQKSRELTQKETVVSDSDEEGVAMDSEDEMMMAAMDNNPWMNTNNSKKESENKKPEAVCNFDDSEGDSSDNEISKSESKGVKEGYSNDNRLLLKEKTLNKDEEDSSEEEDKIDAIFNKLEATTEASEESQTRSKGKKKGNKIPETKQENSKENGNTNSMKMMIEAENDEDSEEDEELISEGLTRIRTLEDVEREDYGENKNSDFTETKRKKKSRRKPEDTKGKIHNKQKKEEVYVDPKKVFTVETKLKSSAATVTEEGSEEEEEDTEEQQRMTIAQAFEDDDVIEEFKQEKKNIIDRDKPKDIDLTLPGWGSWGGTGIQISKRKRKRFILKAPPAPPRKDSNLGNVIISELKDKAISQYQVSDLPFPYGHVKQFEQSIQAPVGKTWNPETAFKQLVKPKVVTRLGKVIAPLDKEETFKKQKTGDSIPGKGDNEKDNKRKGQNQKKGRGHSKAKKRKKT